MDDRIEELELVRLELVENVAKLQGLVKHWRIQEAEYEILKEDLTTLPEDASEEQIQKATRECVGELLTKDEIKSLLEDKNRARKPRHIINLIDRRIDYVQQNVKSIEKRLESEERRLDGANFLGYRDEEGLPLMEITEQLDDDDNVISAAVVRPGDAAPELLDVLAKGGVEGLDEKSGSIAPANGDESTVGGNAKDVGMAKIPQTATELPLKKKKSVTFADNLQGHELPDPQASSTSKVRFAKAVDVSQAEPIVDPIMPDNESEEEIALRRDMLEYNMRKIGTIVAEIDLEEGENDDTNYDEDEDENYEDEDEQEDQFGRTTVQVISEQYRERMLALEKRLNAKAIVNVGPNAEVLQDRQEVMSSPTLSKPKEQKLEASSPEKPRRGVRFADKLGIQDNIKQPTVQEEQSKPKEAVARPLREQTIERKPVEKQETAPPRKKLSKFKASRMAAEKPDEVEGSGTRNTTRLYENDILYPDDPQIPRSTAESKMPSIATVKPTIIEQCISERDIQEPDSLDPDIHAAEIRNAFHDARNKFIQRQNGFMDQDMEQYEDEHGKPQVSRFRAARLARQELDRNR